MAGLRASGFLIGAVVDEAHHSFRPGTESFRFLDTVLDPDLLMCATATPDDGDLEILRRAIDVGRFQQVSVSRTRVVEARLNKPRVNAVSFVARGTSARRLDLNEVALPKAVDQHRALKGMLKQTGIPVVPLLLVQASSTDWTPARVQALLRDQLAFPPDAVAIHTAQSQTPTSKPWRTTRMSRCWYSRWPLPPGSTRPAPSHCAHYGRSWTPRSACR